MILRISQSPAEDEEFLELSKSLKESQNNLLVD